MNPFANPEEALPYELPEFPKPESQVTEYTHQEGQQDFLLKSFATGDPYYPGSEETAVVQPIQLQDFKEILAAVQS